jgi:pyruvate-formate lyase
MCLAVPKFGNDDDYVDSITQELYKFYTDRAVTYDSVFGDKFKPTAVSLTAQMPGGELTGATPDGRYAGECLADEALSAMRGRDTHGPYAVIKSANKIDQVPYCAISLGMKFHPSVLKTKAGMRNFSELIRTYLSLGGKHIQFNVVSNETLLDAQKHPEKYRDLIIRLADYSAHFNSLTRAMQDNIIARTEYKEIGKK